jgi:hypothetical protein
VGHDLVTRASALLFVCACSSSSGKPCPPIAVQKNELISVDERSVCTFVQKYQNGISDPDAYRADCLTICGDGYDECSFGGDTIKRYASVDCGSFVSTKANMECTKTEKSPPAQTCLARRMRPRRG